LSQTRNQPQRTCVGCRLSRNRSDLLRFVLSPQQQLLVDYRQRLPGRGVYTCYAPECVERAVERRQFQRAFKVDHLALNKADLVARIAEEILQKIENLLGIARKSAQIISGGQMVLNGLKGNAAYALVVMSYDISEGVAEKVLSAAQKQNVSIFQTLSKERLGKILGKGERSVAALAPGQLADAIRHEIQSYKRMLREN
jgi:predicted RNA-binding protein YlxR (DUF448 family)